MQWLRRIVGCVPGAKWAYRKLTYPFRRRSDEPFPRGHYYSPLPDLDEVEAKSESLFRTDVEINGSINLQSDSQVALLKEMVPLCKGDAFSPDPSPGFRYHGKNSIFQLGSANFTSGMLLHLQPRRVIEIGSGFSSALMLDVSDRWLQHPADFTFIEPYPDRLLTLLRSDDLERHRLIKQPVQEVPESVFRELQENDILFVDSTHVSKIGSDVNHLLFNVLPNLNPGVVIHFHDVYWPFEYPKSWILCNKWAWNECYILRAFLQYNSDFEILLYIQYIRHKHTELMRSVWPAFFEDPGSALWIRKCQ